MLNIILVFIGSLMVVATILSLIKNSFKLTFSLLPVIGGVVFLLYVSGNTDSLGESGTIYDYNNYNHSNDIRYNKSLEEEMDDFEREIDEFDATLKKNDMYEKTKASEKYYHQVTPTY